MATSLEEREVQEGERWRVSPDRRSADDGKRFAVLDVVYGKR